MSNRHSPSIDPQLVVSAELFPLQLCNQVGGMRIPSGCHLLKTGSHSVIGELAIRVKGINCII